MRARPSTPHRPRDRADRWRHVQATALTLFLERGFDAVSIDDIAAEAGISRRTFFNYFPTKADALFDPDPSEHERLQDLLSQGSDPQADPWTVVATAVLTYLRQQERVVTARRRIIAAHPELDRHHVFANAQFDDTLRRWLVDGGMTDFEARITCALALAPVRVSFMAWDPAEGFPALEQLLLDGFELAQRRLHP